MTSTIGSLRCRHCRCEFTPTISQWLHKNRETYCSNVCRDAARESRKKPLPEHGPCPTCGKLFNSRYKKEFCGMRCYTSSERFIERCRQNSFALANRDRPAKEMPSNFTCIECGKEKYFKASILLRNRRTCSTKCYRLFYAKRYDRWIANPKPMATIQAYDEFLTQDELSCFIEGCQWQGKNLSAHLNGTHGITAKEAKRASGFNLGTGLVSLPLHEKMASANSASPPEVKRRLNPNRQIKYDNIGDYQSREGREHSLKARIERSKEAGPERVCKGCNKPFRQSTVFGRTLFCSFDCRDVAYSKQKKAKSNQWKEKS